jgi:hypothetical protein
LCRISATVSGGLLLTMKKKTVDAITAVRAIARISKVKPVTLRKGFDEG